VKSTDNQNESGEELRSQTDVEQFLTTGGDDQALKKMFGDKLRKALIPFQKLCNHERKKGDTEMIHGVKWKVYRSEQGFNDLFWAWWWSTGEKWKRGDQEIGTVQELDAQGMPRRVDYFGESEREEFAKFAHDTDAWKQHGEQLLESWKKDGVPPSNFLALACFRGYCDFESQVKVITGQNRLDRALPWFRRFLNSRCANEDMTERAMAKYREMVFDPEDLNSRKDAFAKWKTAELSRVRREARSKRGRVKSKNDKRLGARLPS
jgi:hypothetical protein